MSSTANRPQSPDWKKKKEAAAAAAAAADADGLRSTATKGTNERKAPLPSACTHREGLNVSRGLGETDQELLDYFAPRPRVRASAKLAKPARPFSANLSPSRASVEPSTTS